MLNTNYTQYTPNTIPQYFSGQKESKEQVDFATLLAQRSNLTTPDSAPIPKNENPALANLSEEERAMYENFMAKREKMLAELSPEQRAHVEQFSYFAQLDERQKVKYALFSEKYESGFGKFAFEMDEAGLGDVADSMITTAQQDGTTDKLRSSILVHDFLQHIKDLEQTSGAEIGSEEFRKLWDDLASTNPIVAKNPFLGKGKDEILGQLIDFFENHLQSDDYEQKLANEKFSKSMLEILQNA